MFEGVQVGGVGGQKQQLVASGLHQLQGGGRVMEAGVVPHDHAVRRQCRQQDFFKISVHHLGVGRTLKCQRRDQLAVPKRADDAGAFPPLARHGFINPFAPGRPPKLTIQAVIHAALVEVKDGLAAELFEFALKEPALHLAAFAVFDEFFLA